MNQKVELGVIALSKSKTKEDSYVLVLEDETASKRLSILIGGAEAQYIGITLEQLKTKRPLTHDLLASIMDVLKGELLYIYLHSLVEHLFVADVYLKDVNGDIKCIDSRASDAIALAIKYNVPIYTNDTVLNEVYDPSNIYVSNNKMSFADYTLDELKELLEKVLEKEDYESAIRIREFIKNKRK
jgi:uncharacterized protein